MVHGRACLMAEITLNVNAVVRNYKRNTATTKSKWAHNWGMDSSGTSLKFFRLEDESCQESFFISFLDIVL